MNNKVSIGSTSIVGWSGAVLALLPTIIKAVETGQTSFAGPEKYLAITGIALGVITQISRYLQAHKLIGQNVAEGFEELSTAIPNSAQAEISVPVEEAKTQVAPIVASASS